MPCRAPDPDLLAMLACPDTHHAPLRLDDAGTFLTCTACGRVYDIVAGIPVLLLDRGHAPDGPPGEGPVLVSPRPGQTPN